MNFIKNVKTILIPVTRKVKGYTSFVGKYVTSKVYIFFIRINIRVDLAMSVCPMNAEISETIKARILGLGVQILGLPAQRKFVSAGCDYNTSKNLNEILFLLSIQSIQPSRLKVITK